MSNEIEVLASQGVLEVKATGKLTKGFYEAFVPVVEAQIAERGNG